MTLSSSTAALKESVDSLLGVGATPFYADIRTLALGFNYETDAGAAPYAARIRAAVPEYIYVNPVAAGGHAGNTYGAMLELVGTLTAEQKLLPWMLNAEDPWLAILVALDGSTVSASWQSGGSYWSTISEEVSRTGLSLSTPPTLAELKALAIRVWQDMSDYAESQGSVRHGHYAGRMSFSDSMGIPYGARRSDAFPSGMHRMSTDPVYYPTMRQVLDTHVAGGAYRDLAKAQSHASCHLVSVYAFTPNGDRGIDSGAIGRWVTTATRYDAAGVSQSPDFDADQTRAWVRETKRRQIGEYRRAMLETYRLGMISGLECPRQVDAVVLGPFLPAQNNNYVEWLHWAGVDQKEVDRTVEDEVTSLFLPGDLDSPLCGPPNAVWWWCDVSHYFRQRCTNAKSSSPLVAPTRWSIEVWLFGRPRVTTATALPSEPEKYGVVGAAPAGYADWHAYHLDFFDAHSMADTWYTSGKVWWTSGGGSQLPSPCSCAPGNFLEAYGLSFAGSQVLWDDVELALNKALSDRSATFCEAVPPALAAIWR